MASGTGFNGVPEKAKPPVREMVQAWVKLLGCGEAAEPIAGTIEGITTIVHTGGRDGTEVIFTTVEGHGHIWPGGKSPLPAFILGKATNRLNANDAVWDFFQAHPKPESKP
jgi:polyhydroxybutyrate depolymerase